MRELKQWLEQHSQQELARRLGITQGAISQWLKEGRVPVKRAPEVEKATGIPRQKLCPTYYADDAA